MSFLPCSKCNRKYKSERSWMKHMLTHGAIDYELPERVTIEKKLSTRQNLPKNPKHNQIRVTHVNRQNQKDEIEKKLEEAKRLQQLRLEAKKKAEEEYSEKYKEKYLESLKKETEEKECIICFDRKVDAVMVPCGHPY